MRVFFPLVVEGLLAASIVVFAEAMRFALLSIARSQVRQPSIG
jgi:ABC-type spermidine/putrescine transport system permease subunit I